MMRRSCALLVAAALTACSAPAVPDQNYFRMPQAPDAVARMPAQPLPIVVEPLRAQGVYNDQSILYAEQPEGAIRAYHYQLWEEAPGTLLQRRLIAALRARHAAELVTDRLAAAVPALRIGGSIEQFERVRGDSGWGARVRMELRVERDRQSPPLLLHTYGAEVAAANDSVQASVRAFADAVDACLAKFAADLAALPR